ncbi:MAG TPA: nucleotide exchange factor GrpE [Bacteroidales bacterium]|nr:nucleotide exchange factor GrpE [Bacteroidales bacterium]
MIKKKSPSKEETAGRQDDRSTDIKEVSKTEELSDQPGKEVPPQTDNEEQTTEAGEQDRQAADKVGPPEKTIEEKLAEMQDRYIRLSAEFDNYRKRTLREKMELTKFATENILIQILPFMDDFERALINIEDAKECTAVKEGIVLIHTKFLDFFKQNGVSEVEALNCQFNFDLHDAVANMQVEDESKKGKVVEVVQKGYYLHDRVIRHSKVVVGE